MTTIKATCHTCGEVGLTPEEIELRVDRSGGDASYYAFTCPSCLSVVRKPADDRVVRLLISGGVHVANVDEPEPVPLKDRYAGPAISHDDILDFHALLGSSSWFDLLVALTRRENVSG